MKALKFFLFNFFTRQAFYKKLRFEGLGRRIQTMQMDFAYQLFLFIYWLLAGIITLKILAFTYPQNGFVSSFNTTLPHIVIGLMTLVLINKDYFNGQSVINRFQGYQIVDAKTNQTASAIQCAIRNCTLLIWPVEVLFAMANPERRVGDFIAGTKMIETEKSDPESILNDIQKMEFDSVLLKTLLVSAIIIAVFDLIERYL